MSENEVLLRIPEAKRKEVKRWGKFIIRDLITYTLHKILLSSRNEG